MPRSLSKHFDARFADRVTDAEIIICLRLIAHHQSYNSCRDLNATLQTAFPDSEIIRQFSLGSDKAAYSIAFGLAPYFRDQLLDKMLKPTPVSFTTYFDEAFNRIINKS